MIKVGTELVCKYTSIDERAINTRWITTGQVYVVKDVFSIFGRMHYKLTTNGVDIVLSESKNFFYIWDYFYHPAEWREKQIKLILQDEY